MKQKVLVIGIGSFQNLGLEFLKSEGYFIVGVDGNYDAAGKALCNSFYNIELNKKEEILQLAIKENIKFAVGFECDPAVEAINFVNKHLNVNGLNPIASSASLDKLLVREMQEKLNLKCPTFHEISNLESLMKLIKGSANKWVLKPKASSGSRGVQLLDGNSNLENIYSNSSEFKRTLDEPLLLEEYIEGKEIAIDGFCHKGQCHVLTVSYKDRTDPPYLLDTGLLISSDTKVPIVEDAKAQLQKIFTELQRDLNSPYHAEFLVNERGVFMVEFSFRGAGFNVFSKWIPLVTGFDTLDFSVKQIISEISWKTLQSGLNQSIYLGFLDGANGKIKVVNIPEWIRNDLDLYELNIYVKPGDTTTELKSGADRFGHIVLLGSDGNSLKNKFISMKNEIKFIYE